MASTAREGECIPEVCQFVSLSSTKRLLGPAGWTMPCPVTAYPFSSLGAVWLWAENTAQPSGEEWTGQKWWHCSPQSSPSGVEQSTEAAPVQEADMGNQVAAWHNTDNLACASLSISFFPLSQAWGQGEDCRKHLLSCLCPSGHTELNWGGEHIFVCKEPSLFIYSCY